MKKTFFITTPIFYPNAKLHLGHAYTATVCDILARHHRLAGDETYFLTGADENTEKVVRAAKAAGKNTKEYLDEINNNFKNLFSKLQISHDQFIRTTDEKNHWPGVVEIWKRMAAKGDLEKRPYKGFYCVGHEAFITEKDLLDGKCPEHDEAPNILEEENYFFKLSKYTSAIRKKIESGELKIIPESRRNEILALLGRGLEDVSFSRPTGTVSVGIPVPDDPSQKIYVWADALTNYISALGFGRKDDALYKKFWDNSSVETIHVIGKDILRFHAAVWPGMLLSAGLPLPKTILVHGFLTSGGKKMSKTLGNVIDPEELIREYGAEAVRYYLARHISPFEDGDITREGFKDAYNGNLANGLGNLVNRILKMYVDYGVAEQGFALKDNVLAGADEKFFRYDIKSVADLIWGEIQNLDRHIQEREPFKIYKHNPEKAKEIVWMLVSKLYEVTLLLEPFMPETAKNVQVLIKTREMPAKPLFPRKD